MDTIVCLTLLGCLGFVASLPLNVTAAVKPPCICTMQYDPVCGSDGVTYGNKCALDCTGVNMTNKGECRHLCACPRIYKPVCGQDGKTYSNRCVLDCTGFAIFREGPCSTVAADVLCICTFIYQPVCGVDGVTYGNDCNRKCQSIELSHTGPCTGNEKITPMPPTTKAAAVTTTLGGPIPMAPLDLD